MTMALRKKIAAAAASTAIAAGGLTLAAAGPASARASDCFGGYINATWAWGTCKAESGGYGGFAVTVQCYYWGANTSYGTVPETIYSHCPSWSHITSISIYPWAG
jgi:hypothetical protein